MKFIFTTFFLFILSTQIIAAESIDMVKLYNKFYDDYDNLTYSELVAVSVDQQLQYKRMDSDIVKDSKMKNEYIADVYNFLATRERAQDFTGKQKGLEVAAALFMQAAGEKEFDTVRKHAQTGIKMAQPLSNSRKPVGLIKKARFDAFVAGLQLSDDLDNIGRFARESVDRTSALVKAGAERTANGARFVGGKAKDGAVAVGKGVKKGGDAVADGAKDMWSGVKNFFGKNPKTIKCTMVENSVDDSVCRDSEGNYYRKDGSLVNDDGRGEIIDTINNSDESENTNNKVDSIEM